MGIRLVCAKGKPATSIIENEGDKDNVDDSHNEETTAQGSLPTLLAQSGVWLSGQLSVGVSQGSWDRGRLGDCGIAGDARFSIMFQNYFHML